MVKTKDDLLRIFWPNTLTRSITPGVIVGWRNSENDLFVITVLEDVEVRSVEAALRVGTLFRNNPLHLAQICERSSVSVLGTLNHPVQRATFDVSRIAFFTAAEWRRPQIYCPAAAAISVQIVVFDAPNPQKMEYASLQPMSLSLGHDAQTRFSRTPGQPDELAKEEAEERKRKAKLASKLKFHTVVRHAPTKHEVALPLILRQINSIQDVADLMQKNTPLVGPRRKRSMSVSERMVESAQSLYTFAAWSLWNFFMVYAYPLLISLFKLLIVCHRVASEGVLQLLEWHLPIQSIQLPDGPVHGSGPVALKDISAACQQIHLRLEQFSYYPIQYSKLRGRSDTSSASAVNNSDYIRFYNSLWLVANDVIIGIALGSFIGDNAQATSNLIVTVLTEYTIDGLRRMIRWLMSYPGGLKLNTELAAFLGDLFLWVIEYWSATVINVVIPYLPTIVYFIGFSSFAGATMPIAIFSDFTSLLTIHIYSFYIASARIFNWQLTIIVSLFHLFRGKKRNVLRNRIDNCDYDLDQLLLGTIFFTLLFFLLPTVMVFYLTFASARMAIITLKACLDTCLACLNHFPLFALMLRIKDSKRLPGGIHFELHSTPLPSIPTPSLPNIDEETPTQATSSAVDDPTPAAALHPNISYITLSSTPLSLRQIFEQYFQLGNRIRKHYLSPKVVFRLATGRFVPPLGREEMYGLQYSVLPRERVSIGEVWKVLNMEQMGVGQSGVNGHGRMNGLRNGMGKRWR